MAMNYWYISFAETKKFLGGAVVSANTPDQALSSCKEFDPGGSVLICEIPSDEVPSLTYHNRLLTLEEIREFWPDAKRLGDQDRSLN